MLKDFTIQVSNYKSQRSHNNLTCALSSKLNYTINGKRVGLLRLLLNALGI